MEAHIEQQSVQEQEAVSEKGPWVADIKPGDGFIGIYIARNPRLNPFRDPAKGNYMRLILVDRTGSVQARIWDNADLAEQEITDGTPIKVDGVAEQFNEELQVHIRRFRPAKEREFLRSDLIKSTSRDVEKMWQVIRSAVESVNDPYIDALLCYFFEDVDFTARFMEHPAARVIHHAHISGLLEHCFELLHLGKALTLLYPEIDRDLLIAGILLHDIGKLEEYELGYDIGITNEGKLVGHVVLSERLVSEAIRSIDGFPKTRELDILHLILSHHGRYEWGATRRPKSLEAIALHHLDNLDAQVNRFNQLLETARAKDQTWTDYDRFLGRMLYAGEHHGLMVEENGFLD